MRTEDLRALLTGVAAGERSIDEALASLRDLPVADLGFAQIDTHRSLRQGFPEAIYAQSKRSDEIVAIARRMLDASAEPLLITRVVPDAATTIAASLPQAEYHETARMFVANARPPGSLAGAIALVCAGTSDLPVAEEAAVTLTALGAGVTRLNDAGIAGVHRLLAHQDLLRTADVVIAVAGMEGALPTLVGGLTPAPVVAVPTSVGYGSSFEGLAALLTMLNSCASGIVVTNIDNGYGAAMAAVRILQTRGEA